MDKVGKSFQAEGTACAEAGSMEGPASLVVAVAYGAWVFCAGWHYLNTRGHIFLLQKIIRKIRGVGWWWWIISQFFHLTIFCSLRGYD